MSQTLAADPSVQPPPQRSLRRVLGIVFGLAVVIGGVIGSGIMRAPGVVALGLHSVPLTLALWALMGGVAMVTAMPLVEAGAAVPRAGGSYPIATRAFGPTAGFLTGWLTWLQYTASNAFISVVFAEYVHRLGLAEGLSKPVIAIGLILAMTAVNLTATRISGGSQSFASAIKGAAFLIVAAILFVSPRAPPGYHASAAASAHPLLVGAAAVSAIVMAVRVIYQTYAGWDGAIYFSEEVHAPEKNVARATFLGIGLVTIVYLLVNAALFHVLTPAQIAGSELAVGDAVKVSMGKTGDLIVTAIGAVSLAAIVNLQIMASSRITWRMAVDRVLPHWLAGVAKGGAPWQSVAAVALVSAAFTASGSYETIVTIYAPWSIGSIFMICASSVWLRFREPELARPYRAPLFPWVSLFACLVQASLIAVVVAGDPKSGLWSALVVAAPIPLFLWFTRGRRHQIAVRDGGGRPPR
ncbi:MAG TPA: APC family permease [Caulobacteraceae bacterium]|jgi:APA family basic amino acid/polyamine antiporter|nr:APC family permease [Caulobacteraceae bacterium]